jgi:methionyl-tRNA formyltransferase
MQMDAGLDTGPVYASKGIPIGPEQTAAQLHDELALLGAALLRESLPALLAGELLASPQVSREACYAAKLQKSEAWLDWSQPALALHRRIRAFNSWPIAQTRLHDQIIRIWRAHLAAADGVSRQPGRVLTAEAGGILVAAGEGALSILELQRPGGRVLSAADFINAVDLRGARFN